MPVVGVVVGVVVVVAPWNYPYLTAVNAVLPALIATSRPRLFPAWRQNKLFCIFDERVRILHERKRDDNQGY